MAADVQMNAGLGLGALDGVQPLLLPLALLMLRDGYFFAMGIVVHLTGQLATCLAYNIPATPTQSCDNEKSCL